MADHNVNLLALLLWGGLVAYSSVGALVVKHWRRRRALQPLPSPRTDPSAWLSSWLPELIAYEVIAWSGAVITTIIVLAVTPIMRGPNAPYALLGFGIGLVGIALFFAVVDVALVVRVRAIGRNPE
ncbi:MAG TPA: hypothetical protein VFU88_18970 [Ktedonobacterales bacterium]|nr:hypothetical protein [Ktedonobacterales bacterium]